MCSTCERSHALRILLGLRSSINRTQSPSKLRYFTKVPQVIPSPLSTLHSFLCGPWRFGFHEGCLNDD